MNSKAFLGGADRGGITPAVTLKLNNFFYIYIYLAKHYETCWFVYLFLEMYLGTVWYGLLGINDLDVTMATQSGQDSIGLMWILS